MWSKRINYFSWIILLIFGLLFYYHYVLMLLLVFMITLPIASYITLKVMVKKLRITVKSDKASVGKNIPVDVYFGVLNNFPIPLEKVKINAVIYNSFFENEDKYSINISALPYKENRAKLSVSGVYCGRMVAEVTDYDVYDFLGLFKHNIKCEVKTEFFIMPSKEQEYERFVLSPKGISEDEELQTTKGDDVSQISQIRDYIPGDRLSNIHWKLSSKKEELQVKEYSMPFSEDVILLVELFIDKDNPIIFDEIIEVLFSIGNDLVIQRRKFSVSWCTNSNYEIYNYEINNTDDLLNVVKDIFYEKSSAYNGATYETYMAVNGDIKGTLLYLSDGKNGGDKGAKIYIGSERVVLTCQ